MATTGIWKIEKRLDNVLNYTTNIEKTLNSYKILIKLLLKLKNDKNKILI